MIPIHPIPAARPEALDALLEDDPEQHLYRLDRSVFTDERCSSWR